MSIQTAQRQLLKSLSIMGSSQLGIMAVNVIKTKLFSLFLGVEGIGLIGLFTSLIDLIRSVSGLGLQDSGVRYIADKSVNDSEIEKEKEIFVLRRWILFTAFIGAAICFFAATPLCWYMFESHEYVDAVRMLSVCVFIAAVASGQTAIMQALKQIPALAMTNLTSTLLIFVVTVLIAFIYGLKGIVAIMFCNSFFLYLMGRYYLRRNCKSSCSVAVPFNECFRRGVPMARLGILTVITGMASYGSLFLIKGFITREGGLDTAGVFQAAWHLSNLFLGLMLNSMAADFYPRLSEANRDKNALSGLVDSQLYIIVLLVGPLLSFLLAFAPLLIRILYSSGFMDAVPLFRWLMIAFFIKSVTWTMSYVLMAKVMVRPFLFTEICWYLLYLPLIYFLYPVYGITGVGIASCIAYSVYLIPLIILMRRIGCSFSFRTVCSATIYTLLMIGLFVLNQIFHSPWIWIVNILLIGCCGAFSLHALDRIIDIRSIFRKLNDKFRKK